MILGIPIWHGKSWSQVEIKSEKEDIGMGEEIKNISKKISSIS